MHLGQRGPDGLLLRADLLEGVQLALACHGEQWADVQQAAHGAGCLGHAAAAHEERQVGREEPVLQAQSVGLGPGGELVEAHALVALVGQAVDEQSVARARTQRVDDDNPAVGVLVLEVRRGIEGALVRAGDAARECHVKDVVALVQDGLEVLLVLADRHLRGAGGGTGEHLGVELGGGVRLAKVVTALLAVKLIVKEDAGYVAARQ